VVVVGAAAAGACGGGGGDEAGALVPSTSVAGETGVDAPSGTTAAEGFSLSGLPGMFAIAGPGCGSDPTALAGEDLSGVDSVDEAISLVEGVFDMSFQVCLVKPDGSEVIVASKPGQNSGSPGFTYDGSTLYFVELDADGSLGRFTDRTWRAVNLDGSPSSAVDDPVRPWWSTSPDGKWYGYVRTVSPRGLFISPTGVPPVVDGGEPAEGVMYSPADLDGFRWSPTGSALMAYSDDECTGLIRLEVPSLEQVRITGRGTPNEDEAVCATSGTASWSPDGSMVVFEGNRGPEGRDEPFVVNADGTGLRPLLPEGFVDDPEWMGANPVWSPDGRVVLVYVMLSSGESGFWVVSPDGAILERVPWPTMMAPVVMDMAWAPEAPSWG